MTSHDNHQFIEFINEALVNMQKATELYLQRETDTSEDTMIQLSKLQNVGLMLIELLTHQTTPEMLNSFDEVQLSRYIFTIQQLINLRKNS